MMSVQLTETKLGALSAQRLYCLVQVLQLTVLTIEQGMIIEDR